MVRLELSLRHEHRDKVYGPGVAEFDTNDPEQAQALRVIRTIEPGAKAPAKRPKQDDPNRKGRTPVEPKE